MSSCLDPQSAPAVLASSRAHSQIHFLLIEDDEDHAHLVVHHLRRSNGRNWVTHLSDGQEALAFLLRQPPHQDAPRPDVILLDLNLPRLNGHEVLDSIKQDAQLRHIPVVVLTTSDAETDRNRAYRAYANSYVVKPLEFKAFRELVDMLSRYWGQWNHRQGGSP